MIVALLKRIAQQLDANGIPYMIIGGQAVLFHGRPRLTRDIDITLGIDTDQFSHVDRLCRDLGLEPLADDPRAFAVQTKVLPAEDPDTRVRVDFIFSFTPYEMQAIERTKETILNDTPVRFAACEDVIIHKMVAGRPVDLEDVRHLLAKNRESLDLNYLKHWLAEFSQLPGHEQVLSDFEAFWNL